MSCSLSARRRARAWHGGALVPSDGVPEPLHVGGWYVRRWWNGWRRLRVLEWCEATGQCRVEINGVALWMRELEVREHYHRDLSGIGERPTIPGGRWPF